MTRLELKVSPKASRNAVSGWLGEVLKLSITAAPERGTANAAVEAVEALPAEVPDLPESSLRVMAGRTSQSKKEWRSRASMQTNCTAVSTHGSDEPPGGL